MRTKNQNRSRKTSQTGELVGIDVTRLVRLFRDKNRFAGGHYTVKGIELSLPCGKLRLGRMIMPPPIKPPSIFYIGRRCTWTWTIRVWTVAISYLPNAGGQAIRTGSATLQNLNPHNLP
jgi:hypothetical protein